MGFGPLFEGFRVWGLSCVGFAKFALDMQTLQPRDQLNLSAPQPEAQKAIYVKHGTQQTQDPSISSPALQDGESKLLIGATS